MASRPTLANSDDQLKPTTEQVEEFLHRWHDPDLGVAVRRAAWEGDETKAIFDLAKACTSNWPRYHGQKADPDFTNVDWHSLLERERGYAVQFNALEGEYREQWGDDPEQFLNQKLHEDAPLPPVYDVQLLEMIATAAWEAGSDPLPAGENPLFEVLFDFDEDQSFNAGTRQETAHQRIGRVIIGPEAGAKYSHWGKRVDRPRFEVHPQEGLAAESFDGLHREQDPDDYHRDMHPY